MQPQGYQYTGGSGLDDDGGGDARDDSPSSLGTPQLSARQHGPGRPHMQTRHSGSPSGASSSPQQPPQHLPSAYHSPGPGQQDTNHHLPPHLHPAYRGRGRPPLALGRRPMGPGHTQGVSPSPRPPIHQQHAVPSMQPQPAVPPAQQLHQQRHPMNAAPSTSSGSPMGGPAMYHPGQQGSPSMLPQQQSYPQRQSFAVGPSPGTPQQAAQRPRPLPPVQQGSMALQQQQQLLPPRINLDGKEAIYLAPGPTNRLLLSLRSGLPSHIAWALSRLAHASYHQPDVMILEHFPGLLEALLHFPERLVAAIKGQPPETWDSTYWEQDERGFDGIARDGLENPDPAKTDDNDDTSTISTDSESESDDQICDTPHPRLAKPTNGRARAVSRFFDPLRHLSHSRLLENAVSAVLILRNLCLSERNERILIHFSRSLNTLICDLLALPLRLPRSHGSEEFAELEGAEELRVYALDLLEVTRTQLHLRTHLPLHFDPLGLPLPPEVQFNALREMQVAGSTYDAANSASHHNVALSDQIFIHVVWHLHTTNDRSVLIGCLRCLGALASDERNEQAFVERDLSFKGSCSATSSSTSPGILRKCLTLLPLTQDTALLEATLDCLYQVAGIDNNALRLGLTCSDKIPGPLPLHVGIAAHTTRSDSHDNARQQGLDDVRSVVRLLIRFLVYGRVVWDRNHQLTLHPALHMGIPSAVEMRRGEAATLKKKRKASERDEKSRAKTRKLQRDEWNKLKDMTEPDRLKSWMRIVYEPKETAEVSQMEFWTTYSTQFGTYSQLGGPPLQPAAEVIRTVSSVFPGAMAMVLPNQKFVVRGVEARDRSYLRRFECRWQGCDAPETDTLADVSGHISEHVNRGQDSACHWDTCTFAVPKGIQDKKGNLLSHAWTHLPETDEQIAEREIADIQGDYRWARALQTDPARRSEMLNGAHLINGGFVESLASTELERLRREREELKRRSKYNLPIRGTVDWPDVLPFSVTRTPMDPATGRPIGVASTASLILRVLARTSATVLSKAGARKRARASSSEDEATAATKAKQPDGRKSASERFGLPLPLALRDANGTGDDNSSDSAQYGHHGKTSMSNGTAASAGGAGDAAWKQRASMHIMDALIDCEVDMMRVASENDVLCAVLNDALAELQPEQGETVLPAAPADAEQCAFARRASNERRS